MRGNAYIYEIPFYVCSIALFIEELLLGLGSVCLLLRSGFDRAPLQMTAVRWST